MFRPTGFNDLAGKRVGIWGYGVEGRASVRRLGDLPSSIVVVDDTPEDGVIATQNGGLEALSTCDVVLKSPGIPRHQPDVVALEAKGVMVTSALNLWLASARRERVIAVTGTKGKSTTTSLITFFLNVVGEHATSAGNIGLPPYDIDFDDSGFVVLEVSSFQSVDIEFSPGVIVVTSLGSDHLDWHGSTEQYHRDKLSLTRAEGTPVVFVNDQPLLRDSASLLGGDVHFVDDLEVELTSTLGLMGAHNERNVALALHAVSQVTRIPYVELREIVRGRANEFETLRGRFSLIGITGPPTIRFIDDGLATSPLPTIAALATLRDDVVAIILGGYDRGVDYKELIEELTNRMSPTCILTLGPVGDRIYAALLNESTDLVVTKCYDMDEAVQKGYDYLLVVDEPGVVLLSPAAPSFDAYKNWQERSDDFERSVRVILSKSKK